MSPGVVIDVVERYTGVWADVPALLFEVLTV